MRYGIVRRPYGLAVLDRETGLTEHISSELVNLLDMSKVEPLRRSPPTYVEPYTLAESVKRADEASRKKWKRK